VLDDSKQIAICPANLKDKLLLSLRSRGAVARGASRSHRRGLWHHAAAFDPVKQVAEAARTAPPEPDHGQ
jgi:hypothetical protein